MKLARRMIPGISMLALALAAAVSPDRAAAQSDLDSADAQEFMGDWLVTIPTEQGEMIVQLGIEDEGGKVAGTVTMIGMGEQPVRDITRSDDTLQFVLEADAQGQLIPITVQLALDGEELAVHLELFDGDVSVDGVGTRMAS